MKKIILCLGAVLALSACNTMAGAGTDIEHGGEKLHDSARTTQDRMHHDDNDSRY